MRKILATIAVVLTMGLIIGGYTANAAEKLKLGSPLRFHPAHYLIVMAAQEKGIFTANGLDVEWVPFRGTYAQMQAFVAGEARVGTSSAVGIIQANGRGLPAIIVATYQRKEAWHVWVPTASPIKDMKDLKGKKLAISRIGGTDYGYTMLALKSLKMDKDVKIIAVGGIRESVAALKAGNVESSMRSIYAFARLIEKKEVRSVLNINRFIPKDWVVHTIFAHRDMVKNKPDIVGRLVKSMIESGRFMTNNPGWAIAKMREKQRVTEATAKFLFENLEYTDGKIDRKALENVRNFLLLTGLIKKEKAPPIDKIYTTQFTRSEGRGRAFS